MSRPLIQRLPSRLLTLLPRRRRIPRTCLLLFIFLLLLQALLAYLVGNDTRILPAELQRAGSVLLVTAHPDDECLFFAPSVLGVLGVGKARGALLVLSSGNNYGLGDTRKKEVLGSCQALGIEAERCKVLDHPKLQDNPKEWWDTDLIQSIVEKQVSEWDIDAIITFDEGGISGHINHRAVSAAIHQYIRGSASTPPAYELITTSLLRKYISLLDLPLTALPYSWRIFLSIISPSRGKHSGSSGALAVNTWNQYGQTRRAFASHGSQYSWDRHLYMVVSRYVWMNSLRRMPGLGDQVR